MFICIYFFFAITGDKLLFDSWQCLSNRDVSVIVLILKTHLSKNAPMCCYCVLSGLGQRHAIKVKKSKGGSISECMFMVVTTKMRNSYTILKAIQPDRAQRCILSVSFLMGACFVLF